MVSTELDHLSEIPVPKKQTQHKQQWPIQNIALYLQVCHFQQVLDCCCSSPVLITDSI